MQILCYNAVASHFIATLVEALRLAVMSRSSVIAVVALLTVYPQMVKGQAFPGAAGFGAVATGGRGGKVIIVDSTDDNVTTPTEGTLRWACQKVVGPRIIIFRTGGMIRLNAAIDVTAGDLTIAGQSAPGDGICLTGSPLKIAASNVIVRGLRIRPGDGKGVKGDNRDCLQIHKNAKRIILDHCSFTWGTDETIDISTWPHAKGDTVRDITIQWCVIAEGLRKSIHPQGEHSAGLLLWGQDVDRVSLHHNLLAHNNIRNPRIAGNVKAEFINNVIYNWGTQGTNLSPIGAHQDKWGSVEEGQEPVVDLRVNIIGNCWKPGSDTDTRRPPIVVQKMPREPGFVYLKGNVLLADGCGEVATPEPKDLINKRSSLAPDGPVLQLSNVKTEDAYQAALTVLDNCGALSPQRDAVDLRIVNDVRHGTGRIIDSPQDVGGYPEYARGTPPADTDQDGMPDEWEISRRLDPATPNANDRDLDPNYDNIEVYLNGLIPSITAKNHP